MNGRPVIPVMLTGLLLVVILLLLFLYPGGGQKVNEPGSGARVSLLYASTGSMSQLLSTGQIDAFIVWESVVSTALLSGTGKMIATPADMPPPGEWADAACCVLVLRNDLVAENPEIAALLSALTTAAVNRVNEDPVQAENITAEWVYGTKPLLTPAGPLDPLSIEQHAFQNLAFTSTAALPDVGVAGQSGSVSSSGAFMNTTVAQRGGMYLNGTLPLPNPGGKQATVNLGYLPTSDHNAPLFVLVTDADFFCDRYGFCLKQGSRNGHEANLWLMAGDEELAVVNLVPGQSGGGLMTTIGQKALDGAYLGSVPAELQIGLGNPSSIIQSVNSGGTGLVVSPQAPCDDWNTFIDWAEARSLQGRPLVIATVQSSIQEEMIRSALAYENITVVLYGSPD